MSFSTPNPGPVVVDILNNGLDYATFVVACLALVATGVGAWLIYQQVRQTRASVQATQESLTLAHEEQQISRDVILASARSQIDKEMPKLTVVISAQSTEVRIWDGDPLNATSTNNILDSSHEFVMPRDNGVFLEVAVGVHISNDGPRRARVDLYPKKNYRDPSVKEVFVGVGETKGATIYRIEPLGTWIGYAKHYAGEAATDVAGNDLTNASVEIGRFRYAFPGDTGATEVHRVVQVGSILERVPANDAGWRLKPLDDNPELSAAVEPFTRDYYASVSRNVRLDPSVENPHNETI